MKRIFLSALIGLGMVAAMFQILSGSAAARTPEDYPLVCRGGGSLAIGTAPGEGNIGFRFTRGTKPAGEGLAPGECSWKDRGMYPNEPDRVSQHIEEVVGAPKPGWYEELHSSGRYWTFMVSNNGAGQLIATSARSNGGIDVPPKKKEKVPEPEVPGPIGSLDDPGRTGPGDTKVDCGMTLPCGGTVSQGAPAFSIVNLGGASIRAQGGGAGLFRSAIIAKNTSESGIGIWSTTASNDANVVITNTGSGDLLRGFSGGSGGDLVFQVLNNGTTNVKALETSISTGSGVHGRSSANNLFKSDSGVLGENTGGGVGVRGESNGTAGVLGSTTGKGGAGVTGISFNAEGVGGRFTNPKGGTALEVTGNASMSDVEVNVLTIRGGSDLAERFEVSDEAKPGMVMAIDVDHPGMLCIARGTYNRRVAGILSGANDLGAGMVLADLPGAKHSMPLALSGRVWVYADATSKAIEPGDLLTTADLPGYAMAVTDYTRARGAIIGKAMTGLKQGKGLILIFVTLQ
jgi:hypothetical protein